MKFATSLQHFILDVPETKIKEVKFEPIIEPIIDVIIEEIKIEPIIEVKIEPIIEEIKIEPIIEPIIDVIALQVEVEQIIEEIKIEPIIEELMEIVDEFVEISEEQETEVVKGKKNKKINKYDTLKQPLEVKNLIATYDDIDSFTIDTVYENYEDNIPDEFQA